MDSCPSPVWTELKAAPRGTSRDLQRPQPAWPSRSRQNTQCPSQAWLLCTLPLGASRGRSMFPSKVNQVLAGFPPRKSVGFTALCWLPPSPPRLQERRTPWGGCSSYLCTLAQRVLAVSPAVAVEAVSLRALMPLPLEVLVEVEIEQPRLPVTEPSGHTGIYPLSRSDHPHLTNEKARAQ